MNKVKSKLAQATAGIATAREAAVMLQAEIRRSQQRMANLRKAEERREAARRKQIIDEDVPLRLKNFSAELEQAISNRQSSFDFGVNNSIEAEIIKPILEAKGYRVSPLQSESGETNMGDFNAPCVVPWEKLWLTVAIPEELRKWQDATGR